MGSIQTRTNPGGSKRYVARIRHRGQERAKSFPTHADAEDWLRKFAPSRSQRWNRTLDRLPLGSYMDHWVPLARTSGTQNGRRHLAENLGDLRYMKIGDIEPQDIRDWLEELEDGREWAEGKPLARSTALSLLGHLSSAFSYAIGEGALITNPCSVLNLRRGVNKAIPPTALITVPEIAALAKAAYAPIDDMIRVVATTGLRSAELGGLTPRNVNLYRREVYVTQQAVGRGRDFQFGPLKSDAGQRKIPIPDETVDVLARAIEKHPDEPDLPVFRTDQGIMWTSSNMGRAMRLLSEDCEIKVTWKSLRHFYASRLIDSGANVKTVQDRMGHSSPMVTLSVYTHLFPHEDEKTRSAFSGLF